MKRFLIIAIVSLTVSSVYAQDNSYPGTGNVGIGTLSPQSYFHGGNNKVLEILNANTTQHSQSHLVLSTGSTLGQSSAGTVTWVSKNSAGSQGMGYIAVQSVSDNSLNATGKMYFATADAAIPVTRMVLDNKGMVGIGTLYPTEMLSVNGKIRAHEIKVETANWPDYVFDQGYKVLGLPELESYIKVNKHLPEMPSAKEIEKDGVAVGDILKVQQKKIEELTLILIQKNKELSREKSINKKQEERLGRIETLLLKKTR